MRKRKYDWETLQIDYDKGLTYRGLTEKYGICSAAIIKGVKKGWLKTRPNPIAQKLYRVNNLPKKHKEESKQKIARARVAYLLTHPDKVPYRINHSSKRSMPEILFEKALKKNGIYNFISEYQNGLYSYDFAFLNKKIDVEIDGGTHLSEKVIKIDKRRDLWSLSNGWIVLRFTATEVLKNVNVCIQTLLSVLENTI